MSLSVEEIASAVLAHNTDAQLVCGIIVGVDDIERLKNKTTDVLQHFETKSPGRNLIGGVDIFEDPGLPSGNFQVVTDRATLAERLYLIRLGLTVTPDGTIKPAEWWRKIA